jgi:hypothetical protein
MGLDSVELLVEIENYFGIEIPNNEAAKIYTVGNMVDGVARILRVEKYDFSLRQNTFNRIKEQAQNMELILAPFLITSLVKRSFNIHDCVRIMELEHATGLNFPGIKKTLKDDRVIKKFKNWLNLVKIDFETVT